MTSKQLTQRVEEALAAAHGQGRLKRKCQSGTGSCRFGDGSGRAVFAEPISSLAAVGDK